MRPDCRVHRAGAESKASGENEDEGWTRQGRGKKSQAVTRGQSSVQVCIYWPGAGLGLISAGYQQVYVTGCMQMCGRCRLMLK